MQPHTLNLSWLLTLRWGAAAGQIAIIVLVDRFMHIELPLLALGVIIGVEILSNAACALWARRAPDVPEWMVSGVLLLDVLLLTALLYFTGGPFNPFSFLYLVNLALAAVVLRPVWAWSLGGMLARLLRHALLRAHSPAGHRRWRRSCRAHVDAPPGHVGGVRCGRRRSSSTSFSA